MIKIVALFFGAYSISMAPVLCALESETNQKLQPVTTVLTVDLKRYQGLWYEIARLPNRFQRRCAKSTTAQYSLRIDGRIDVINKCITNEGKTIEAKGIARIVDSQTYAKLKVSFVKIFGWSIFWGDYWIIGLDENYDYAIVSDPNRRYGWILSRTPALSLEQLNQAYEILRNQGYDPDKFIMTSQEIPTK